MPDADPRAARARGLTEPCAHGGAFFAAIGEDLRHLERRSGVINADVLDAWFDPAPEVVTALREHLPWLLKTSPPTHAEGLVSVIARERGVAPDAVLPGGGSSELIFLALPRWCARGSRVLLLDPTYGEYGHLLGQVLGCHVEGFPLARGDGYRVDAARLARTIEERPPDLLVVVNPNSPTGVHLARADLERALAALPPASKAWIDETYVEYAPPGSSLERYAAASRNVVVSKSMSKVYALSGVRAAYLVGPPALLAPLKAFVPPWAVGLLAQAAAVRALSDRTWYPARWQETHALRAALAQDLGALGLDVVAGSANFLLAHLPPTTPTAADVTSRAAARGLYVRDLTGVGTVLGDRAIRVAVKDAATNGRMVEILAAAIRADS
jgi:histidinol-phosphate/aromatic aminotransferase/cobyric acid decarboxylase-like protein